MAFATGNLTSADYKKESNFELEHDNIYVVDNLIEPVGQFEFDFFFLFFLCVPRDFSKIGKSGEDRQGVPASRAWEMIWGICGVRSGFALPSLIGYSCGHETLHRYRKHFNILEGL